MAKKQSANSNLKIFISVYGETAKHGTINLGFNSIDELNEYLLSEHSAPEVAEATNNIVAVKP